MGERILQVPGVRMAAALLCLAGSAEISAQEEGERKKEYRVKAAFLLNFVKFVKWPESAFKKEDEPFIIGVLGKDPFGKILETTFRKKRVRGRPFVIRRFGDTESPGGCHLLFVSDSMKAKHVRILENLKEDPVLTVGETPKFATRGGTINFYLKEGKVRFEINSKRAKAVGLKINARLLNLAKIVESP